LGCRAIERAQINVDLAQRRFLMVDPANRLVADALESNWNEKLRALAKVREEREQARRNDNIAITHVPGCTDSAIFVPELRTRVQEVESYPPNLDLTGEDSHRRSLENSMPVVPCDG
jgi:hypothetical protein